MPAFVSDPSRRSTEAGAVRAGSSGTRERLDVLDGMRGLAVLLVVIYHYLARWAVPLNEQTFYPHGNVLPYLPIVAHFGRIGVLIFFLISGFVIVMTLERSRSILDFASRRIARLWPAMIVCASLSTAVVAVSGIAEYYPGMGRWSVNVREYLFSILFIPPDLFGADTDRWVEGVYWTLWHEVRFYALVALVFLVSPRVWFLWSWTAVQSIAALIEVVHASTGQPYPAGFHVHILLQPDMLGWFSLGICGYAAWNGRRDWAVGALALSSLVSLLANDLIVFEGSDLVPVDDLADQVTIYLSVAVPFTIFILRSDLLSFLTWRPFLVVGYASYPLYLFHELPGMAAFKFGSEAGWPPLAVLPLTFLGVIFVAICLHRLVENPVRAWMSRAVAQPLRAVDDRFPWLRY